MPKHHFVLHFFSISFEFFLSLNLKDSHNFDGVLIVGDCMGILNVFFDPSFVVFRLQFADVAFQLQVFDINITHFGMIDFLVHQL